MSRREKRFERLAAMETELHSRLRAALDRVVREDVSFFFMTPEFNPFSLPEHSLPREATELAELAGEALRLSESLKEPSAAPVGSLLRRYLERATNLADHHRPGHERLARELLAELDALSL